MPDPPLRLFLVRHGETDYNKRGIIQGGGIDASLNQTGRWQAERFHLKHHQVPFRAVYTSGLRRTLETVADFHPALPPPTQLAGLNECHWGEFEGVEFSPKLKQKLLPLKRAWAAGEVDRKVPGGGESPQEVWNRAYKALKTIENTHPEGGDVLVCTHGRLLRVLLSGLLGNGLHEMERFAHANTGLNVLVKHATRYRSEILNDLSHLALPT